MNKMAEYNLFQCRINQPFRVAVGKSYWHWYNSEMLFPQSWNLREILRNEIVIEFDNVERDIALEACRLTTENLKQLNISFEVWDHMGKSPHLHIHNLPIPQLSKNKLKEFKKFLVRKFVPEEYHEVVDFSLCGIHLVAIENVNHWKGKYEVKKLIWKVDQ